METIPTPAIAPARSNRPHPPGADPALNSPADPSSSQSIGVNPLLSRPQSVMKLGGPVDHPPPVLTRSALVWPSRFPFLPLLFILLVLVRTENARSTARRPRGRGAERGNQAA